MEFPHASEPELHRRLEQRRAHLAEVRDELDTELDVKPQARFLLGAAKEKLREGKAVLEQARGALPPKVRRLSASARSGPEALPGQLARWKPLVALAASAAIFLLLLRRLLQELSLALNARLLARRRL